MVPVGAPAVNGTSDPSVMAAGPAGAKPAATTAARTYIIGAEDVLAILVFEDAEFNVNQMVRPDGKITLPLLGEITATGKTPAELESDIGAELLDKYMKEPPHVSVVVAGFHSKNYYVTGEGINKPGKYPLIVPTTVMEALIEAGSFRDFADKKHIRILRGEKILNFNYNEVIKGKRREQNIQLLPGDQIIVK
jgi:polysaccharide export outer membrane protein